MKLKIDKEDCRCKGLKIPKGYEPIWDWECFKEYPNNKELRELLTDGFVWVMTHRGIRAASLDCSNNGQFHIYCISSLYFSGRSRGVFVKKEKEDEKTS